MPETLNPISDQQWARLERDPAFPVAQKFHIAMCMAAGGMRITAADLLAMPEPEQERMKTLLSVFFKLAEEAGDFKKQLKANVIGATTNA